MEPIRIEIALKAENGQAEAANAAKAETPEESPRELAFRIAKEKADILSKSCRSFTDLLRELCRDYADTHDDAMAGKIGAKNAAVLNFANLMCIEAAIRTLRGEGER